VILSFVINQQLVIYSSRNYVSAHIAICILFFFEHKFMMAIFLTKPVSKRNGRSWA